MSMVCVCVLMNNNKNNADAKYISTDAYEYWCGVLPETSAGPNTELNLSVDGTKTAAERERETER